MQLTYEPRWKHCRERVADLLGAGVDECVLVPNATHGVNTVLRNLDWKKGDVIIQSMVLLAFKRRVTEVVPSEHDIQRR